MKAIAVYCGASPGKSSSYTEAAESLGRLMAARNLTLVYGGGSVGLMGTIGRAVIQAGGSAIGVITEDLMNREVGDTQIPDLRVVKTMAERKTLMEDLADGFIAMPGGYGTLDEIFEILTDGQLGYHRKPCGFLNTDGYYDSLLAFLDRSVDDQFLPAPSRAIALSETDPGVLLQAMESFNPIFFDKTLEARSKSGLL